MNIWLSYFFYYLLEDDITMKINTIQKASRYLCKAIVNSVICFKLTPEKIL